MGAAAFVNVTKSWKCIPIEVSDSMGKGILDTLLDDIGALVRISMQCSRNEAAHLAYVQRLRSSSHSLTLIR
jgi:hypothetical protein